MKYLSTILVFLIISLTHADPYKILWNNPVVNVVNTGEPTLTLDFKDQVNIDIDYKVGYLRIKLNGEVQDVNFSKIEYVPCSLEEDKILNKDVFGNKINYVINNVTARNEVFAIVDVLPVLKGKDGKLFKIKSFEINASKSNLKAVSPSSSRTSTIKTSVLSEGDWYKVSVGSAGIYKLDYNFLNSAGIPVGNIDPKTLQIYGFGGMLAEKNSDFRYKDLPEVPIKFIGNSDAKFDANEYILVFLQGPDKLNYDFSYDYEKNIYSDKAYYFITHSQNTSKTIAIKDQWDTFDEVYDSYDFYYRHENDEVTFLPSGRKWYGESLAKTPDLSFNIPIPELVDQSSVFVTGVVSGSNPQSTNFSVSFNGQGTNNYVLQQKPSSISNSISYTEVVDVVFSRTHPSSAVTGNYSLNIQYGKADFNKKTNLDYFQIEATAKLLFNDNFMIFRNKSLEPGSKIKFQMSSNNGNVEVWDISRIDSVMSIPLSHEGSAHTFIDSVGFYSEYIAVNLSGSFSNPTFVQKVATQNLHGEPTPDLLIITHTSLTTAAEELADFRRSHNGYNVQVVTTEKIFNEFSSGAQDLSAIRDYVKHLYDNDPSRLKWVLLFGACSYDYKDRLPNNTNLVPIYETLESNNTVDSYSSDDYLGFLDPNEGGSILGALDVAIGRLPVRNLSEAQALVKKLKHYNTSNDLNGPWKNNNSFVCDDGDANTHLIASEELVQYVAPYNKALKINKLYLPLFPEVATPTGQTSPILNERIISEVERGTFILNYSGHGREIGWAGENLITLETIKNFKNINKLFLMIAGTCEFGRYDAPEIISGVQEALFNNNGGAIATIAAARPVYASGNKDLNKLLLKNIYEKSNGTYRTLGEILCEAKKMFSNSPNSKSYALLGDPSITLAYPNYDISIDSIVDENAVVKDTVKALSKITIHGSIKNNNTLVSNFSGEVTLTLYDKELLKVTKFDPESEPNAKASSIEKKVKIRESIIYQGKVAVKNGLFKSSFIIPKDISYLVGNGLILTYAKNDSSSIDAWGGFSDFLIGDSEDKTLEDNNPPVVKAYINDTTFKDGGLAGRDIVFLAKITDESGINLSRTAVGHEITLILDGKEENRYILNEYYVSEQNSFNKGSISYPLYGLAAGVHTLTIKVWDVFNNSSTQTVHFEVIENNDLTIGELYTVPSPEEEFTVFKFSHNRAGEDLTVSIDIFDVQGNLVKELSAYIPKANAVVSDLTWHQKSGNQYANPSGLYIYKVFLKSEHDGDTDMKTHKLVFMK